MTVLRTATWVVVWLALLVVPSSLAAADDDQRTCLWKSGDLAIAACTRAIESGKFKGGDLAALYGARASAYNNKGDYAHSIADFSKAIELGPKDAAESFRDYYFRGAGYFKTENYDRAISDFNQALQLNPKASSAYYLRGSSYRIKGEYDRALADFTQMIVLAPSDALNYFSRGTVYQEKGDYDKAIADYTEAIQRSDLAEAYLGRGIANLYAGSPAEALANVVQASALDPKNMTIALWLDIVSKRNNVPSRLPESLSQLDMTKWPAPVLRMFLGQLTPDAVLAAADDRDGKTKQFQVCEANFYSGQRALEQGAKDDAIRSSD